jgi:hypothetical protein
MSLVSEAVLQAPRIEELVRRHGPSARPETWQDVPVEPDKIGCCSRCLQGLCKVLSCVALGHGMSFSEQCA